ncbi:hypothetical protein EII31_05530 [Leucobacter sp. OH2974_COT-288]|nr:hypothetical protein EII31_05530 [Leucobacter sp. OH2974_COT-288]
MHETHQAQAIASTKMAENPTAAAAQTPGFAPLGEPTLRQIMLRPKWLAALFAVLLIAAGFASLAQWQMSHAIRLDQENFVATEEPQPLYQLSPPQEPVRELAAGHRVIVTGALDAASLQLISERRNDTELGYWVAGQLRTVDAAAGQAVAVTEQNDNLAVAIGWAATEAEAATALQRLQQHLTVSAASGTQQATPLQLVGRYNPSEAPRPPLPASDGGELYTTLAPGQQLNLWANASGDTFPGYVVLDADNAYTATSGLLPIHSPAPEPVEKINWLNLFYAIEWVIFAGFAFYFWVRLCRDAHEKEHEILHLQALESANSATQKE